MTPEEKQIRLALNYQKYGTGYPYDRYYLLEEVVLELERNPNLVPPDSRLRELLDMLEQD